MKLSRKQIKQIKKEYPAKSVEQLSRELKLKPRQILEVLGLQAESRSLWIENLTGYLACILLLIAPFVFIRGLCNFADLPQRVFIQDVTICLLLLCIASVVVKGGVQVIKNPLAQVTALLI